MKLAGSSIVAPAFESVANWQHAGQGFTFSLLLADHASAKPGDVLLDARAGHAAGGAGVALVVCANSSVRLLLSDSKPRGGIAAAAPFEFGTDPICSAALKKSGKHHLGVVVDAGPMILTYIRITAVHP